MSVERIAAPKQFVDLQVSEKHTVIRRTIIVAPRGQRAHITYIHTLVEIDKLNSNQSIIYIITVILNKRFKVLIVI